MMLRILLATSLALSAPVLAANPPSRVDASQGEDRESLEEMLERLDAKRAAMLAELDRQLQPLLLELKKEIENKSAKRMTNVRERIASLGPAIAPLLTPSLDPGVTVERDAIEYARQLSRTLTLIPTTAITDEMLKLCSSGSPLGKQNAIRVLAYTPEPERVSPKLIERYGKTEGQERAMLLQAIAQLGQPGGDKLLSAALMGEDEQLRSVALDAIVTAGAAQFADEVLVLLRNLDLSAGFAYKFVAYYSNCPDVVDKEHVGALLDAAMDNRVKSEQRIAILAKLPTWERWIDSKMKRSLKDLKTPGNRAVEQQGQILLAVLGDSGSRKRLLKPYDDEVEKAGNWTGPYVDRGMILYQINEFSQALRDFKQAIKLSKDEPRSVPSAYEYAARCHARLGKLKQAAEMLRLAPIDLKQLRALASDPVFKELRESRYGKVFRLED